MLLPASQNRAHLASGSHEFLLSLTVHFRAIWQRYHLATYLNGLLSFAIYYFFHLLKYTQFLPESLSFYYFLTYMLSLNTEIVSLQPGYVCITSRLHTTEQEQPEPYKIAIKCSSQQYFVF